MTPRRARRWLFAVLALALPLPLLGPFEGMVPPVRHLILLCATGAVALAEGAAGPVPGILTLFAVHALVTLAGVWGLAWLAARALAPLPPRARRGVVLAACALGLAAALAFDLYRTPFGRAPTANLLGVLS